MNTVELDAVGRKASLCNGGIIFTFKPEPGIATAGYAVRQMIYNPKLLQMSDEEIEFIVMHELGHDLVVPMNLFAKSCFSVIALNLAKEKGTEFLNFAEPRSASIREFTNLLFDEIDNFYQCISNSRTKVEFGDRVHKGLAKAYTKEANMFVTLPYHWKVHIAFMSLIAESGGLPELVPSKSIPEESREIFRKCREQTSWGIQDKYKLFYDISVVWLTSRLLRASLTESGMLRR